jgi:uncharacterized protein (DUF488 family)
MEKHNKSLYKTAEDDNRIQVKKMCIEVNERKYDKKMCIEERKHDKYIKMFESGKITFEQLEKLLLTLKV